MTYVNDDKKEEQEKQTIKIPENNLNLRMINDDSRLILDEYDDYFHKFDTIKNTIEDNFNFSIKQEISADYLFSSNQANKQEYYKSFEPEVIDLSEEIKLESHLDDEEAFNNFYTDERLLNINSPTPVHDNSELFDPHVKSQILKDEMFQEYKDYLVKENSPTTTMKLKPKGNSQKNVNKKENDELDEFSDYFAN